MKSTPEQQKTLKLINEVLNNNKMTLGMHITFPRYRILPDEVILAKKIMAQHGMMLTMTLDPIK